MVANIEPEEPIPHDLPADDVDEVTHDELYSSDTDTVTTEDIWKAVLPEYRPRVWITMDLPPWFVALTVYLFSLGIGMWKSDTVECRPGTKF